jgi:hypothetical protein
MFSKKSYKILQINGSSEAEKIRSVLTRFEGPEGVKWELELVTNH